MKDEKSLPSARAVASVLRRHLPKTDTTALFSQMSHFIALDTISIPVSQNFTVKFSFRTFVFTSTENYANRVIKNAEVSTKWSTGLFSEYEKMFQPEIRKYLPCCLPFSGLKC